MSPGRIVIGTRGSPLARWQADHVAKALVDAHPGLVVEQSIIVTAGDRQPTGLLADAGGKGLWVEEIERALQAGTIDVAVHSLKDVPAKLGDGLFLCAHPRRADARDALVSAGGLGLAALPAGARIGTSSPRRACQIKAARPDLELAVLRGNVDTRLRRVNEGAVDAAILACAGLDRLGHADRISERLSIDVMLPAIGQGVLALETRADDARARALCQVISDPDTETAVAAERALLSGLGADCRTPVAGHARVVAGRVEVRGLVGRLDGTEILSDVIDGPAAHAAALGGDLARRLLARGAAEILARNAR